MFCSHYRFVEVFVRTTSCKMPLIVACARLVDTEEGETTYGLRRYCDTSCGIEPYRKSASVIKNLLIINPFEFLVSHGYHVRASASSASASIPPPFPLL